MNEVLGKAETCGVTSFVFCHQVAIELNVFLESTHNWRDNLVTSSSEAKPDLYSVLSSMSTREVWRARRQKESCTGFCSRLWKLALRQLQPLISILLLKPSHSTQLSIESCNTCARKYEVSSTRHLLSLSRE